MPKPTRLAAAAIAAAATLLALPAAQAQSSGNWDLGVIYPTAAQWCPVNTLEAAGQTLPIMNNQALYSIFGTTYGGDGMTNFMLPDLRARVPTGYNQSSSNAILLQQGQTGGVEPVPITLSVYQMPAHTHTATGQLQSGAVDATLNASVRPPTIPIPKGASLPTYPNSPGVTATGYAMGNPTVPMSRGSITASLVNATVNVTVAPAGGTQPIPMARDPYIALRYCIVVNGTYPSRP